MCNGLLAMLLVGVPSAWAGASTIVGEARSLKDGAFVYRELHQCSTDGTSCIVEYQNSRGEIFARKEVNYSTGLYSPSLVLEDFRDTRGSQRLASALKGVVVDAGFDHYVRHRWGELASGETVEFPFLVAGREKPLPMSAQRDDNRGCEAQRLCLLVTLDMWLLAKLVDPIRLVYDEQRRLLQFSGRSNLPDDSGDPQSVVIDYVYHESTL